MELYRTFVRYTRIYIEVMRYVLNLHRLKYILPSCIHVYRNQIHYVNGRDIGEARWRLFQLKSRLIVKRQHKINMISCSLSSPIKPRNQSRPG